MGNLIVTVALYRPLIRPLPLFANLSDSDLDAILAMATMRRFPAGVVAFEQGDAAESFFVLLQGRLRVTQVTPDGHQIIVRMVNPGDLCGIARAMGRRDYPGTATAMVDSLALAWPMDSWDDVLAQHPGFAVNAMKTIGGRLMEAQERVRELSTEEVERRVARVVLRLAKQSGRKETQGIRIDFPISKQDIAEMAGTTLHTVSRILTGWEDDALVQGGRQKLLVKEPSRLALIAEGHAARLAAEQRSR